MHQGVTKCFMVESTNQELLAIGDHGDIVHSE